MSFIPSDPIILVVFCIFGAMMFFAETVFLKKTGPYKKWMALLIALLSLGSILTLSGIMKRYMIPLLPLFMFLTILLGVVYARSSHAKKMSELLPFSILIGFQLFRFPLEIILHYWAEGGTIPSTMTWTGSNWDILAGIAALVSIPLVNKFKIVAWSVQVFGFILLMNVFRVVVMSSPFPFSWPIDNPVQLGLHFPYVLIIPLFVLPALVLHLVTFRKLFSEFKSV